jgi:predicted 3-demethylubiquinone-9 3-methyltransferase (glyoxalase superfamily)
MASRTCCWLKDRFGVSWQIVPNDVLDMVADPDPANATRVAEAMLKMLELDTTTLRSACPETAN